MRRVRLDSLLSERGVFPSRSRAAASVLAGEVMLLPERRRAEKPGQLVAEDVELELRAAPAFVSRGGVKLANALDAFGIDVSGRHALDVGASTGGFTDCLLARGAAHVIALDVAYGQLDWRLRSDSRVTVIERGNARALDADELPYRPDLIVIDVSFISVAKVLPRGARLRGGALRLPGAWSSPSSRSAGPEWGRAAWSAMPELRRQALIDAAQAAARSARRCSATPARGCPAPRATSRRSCGSPRGARRRARSRRGGAARCEP